MNKAILVRYGELTLKKGNRDYFKTTLVGNVQRKLSHLKEARYVVLYDRLFVEGYSEENEESILNILRKIPGIYSVSPCVKTNCDIEEMEVQIQECARQLDLSSTKTFKVSVHRNDKSFPMKSPDIAARLGGKVFELYPHLKVSLDHPEEDLELEIRTNGCFFFMRRVDGPHGLPVGTSGRGLLLLSGGIDSPVAGYMMATRGMQMDAVHFYSYPFTSEKAKEKTVKLARLLSQYTGNFNLYLVNIAEIQKKFHTNCNPGYSTLLLRRAMLKIAQAIAEEEGQEVLITGDSLAQVASQTLQALQVVENCITIPVFRPLIGVDKEYVIKISRKIEMFETSILPYEDCCTVFTPRKPVTRPKLEPVIDEEIASETEELLEEAFENREFLRIKPESYQ